MSDLETHPVFVMGCRLSFCDHAAANHKPVRVLDVDEQAKALWIWWMVVEIVFIEPVEVVFNVSIWDAFLFGFKVYNSKCCKWKCFVFNLFFLTVSQSASVCLVSYDFTIQENTKIHQGFNTIDLRAEICVGIKYTKPNLACASRRVRMIADTMRSRKRREWWISRRGWSSVGKPDHKLRTHKSVWRVLEQIRWGINGQTSGCLGEWVIKSN